MPRKAGGAIACPKCPEKFTTKNGLTRHLGQQHGVSAAERLKRPDDASAKKTRGRPHKTVTGSFVTVAVDGDGAKATAVRLLGQLKEIRLKLDQRISAVQELVEVL